MARMAHTVPDASGIIFKYLAKNLKFRNTRQILDFSPVSIVNN